MAIYIILWVLIGMTFTHLSIKKMKKNILESGVKNIRISYFDMILPSTLIPNQMKRVSSSFKNMGVHLLNILGDLFQIVSTVFQVSMFLVFWPIALIYVFSLVRGKTKDEMGEDL